MNSKIKGPGFILFVFVCLDFISYSINENSPFAFMKEFL